MPLRRLAPALSLLVVMAACSPPPSVSPSASTAVLPSPSRFPTGSPAATIEPLPTAIPTMFVPASEAFTAGLLYRCGATPFPIEVFDAPGEASLSEDPPARLLRGGLIGLGARAEWWLLHRTSTEAEYVGRQPEGGYEYAIAEFADGIWRLRNWGDCELRAEVGERTGIGWWIPEARWPAPEEQTLRMTVRDECPDTVERRLADPIIRYGPDAILIILAAEPVGAPHPHCGDGSDQLARVTLDLDEPVGDRSLWDGLEWPLRDAHTETDRLIFCCG